MVSVLIILSAAAYLDAKPYIPMENIPLDAPADTACNIEMLYSKNSHDVACALKELIILGEKGSAAIPFLESMLVHGPEDISSMFSDEKNLEDIVRAISAAGPKSIPVLQKLIKSGLIETTEAGIKKYIRIDNSYKYRNSYIRQYTAECLGDIDDTASIEILTNAVKDPEWSVQSGAVNSLAKIGSAGAIRELIKLLNNTGVSVTDALKDCKSAVKVQILAEELNIEKKPSREKIASLLYDAAPAIANQILISLNEPPDPKLNFYIMRAKIETGATNSVELLKKAANSPNRWAKKFVLTYIKEKERKDTLSVELISKFSKDADAGINTLAAMMLYDHDKTTAVKIISDAVRNTSMLHYERDEVLDVLLNLKFKNAAVKDAIAAVLKSEKYGEFNFKLIKALAVYDEDKAAEIIIDIIKKYSNAGWDIVDKFEKCSRNILEKVIIKGLEDNEGEIKGDSIYKAGIKSCTTAVDLLSKIAGTDRYDHLRKRAEVAIAKIKIKTSKMSIIDGLQTRETEVQTAALNKIIETGDTSQIKLVINMLGQNEENQYNNLYSVMKVLPLMIKNDDTESIALLTGLMKAKSPHMRKNAAKLLRKLGWKPRNESEAAIFYMALGNYFVCSRLGKKVIKEVIEELNDPFSYVRLDAFKTLSYSEGTMVIDLINKFIVDPDLQLRTAACDLTAQKKDIAYAPAFLKALKGDDVKIRYMAAKELIDLKYREAVPALKEFIKTRSYSSMQEISYDKMDAIEKSIAKLETQDSQSIILLLRDLKSDDFPAKIRAIEAFTPFNDKSVEIIMAGLLKDDEMIRRKAAEALKSSGWKPSNDTDEVYFNLASNNFESIKKDEAKTIKILSEELDNAKTPNLKLIILRGLKKLNALSISAKIIKLLRDDPSVHVKIEAIASLGELKETNAVELIIDALKKPVLASHAAEALAKIKDPRAVLPLIEILKSDSSSKWAATRALGELNDPRAIKPLEESLGNKESLDSFFGIEALKKMGGGSKIDNLVNLLHHRPWSDLKDTVGELKKLGWKPKSDREKVSFYFALLIGNEFFRRQSGMRYIGPEGRPDIQNVRPGASFFVILDQNITNEIEAVKELSGITDSESVYMLVKLFDKPKADPGKPKAYIFGARSMENLDIEGLKPVAASALANINTKQAREGLMIAVRDENSRARKIAEDAIKKIGSEMVSATSETVLKKIELDFTPMVLALKDKEEKNRKIAAEQLGKLGWKPKNNNEKIIYALVKGDDFNSIDYKDSAYEVLIAEAYDKNSALRMSAVKAVSKMRISNIFEVMLPFLKDEDPYIKENAFIAISKINDGRILEPLFNCIFDRNYGYGNLLNNFARIKNSRVPDHIIPILYSIDYSGRQEIAGALRGAGWKPKNIVDGVFYFLIEREYGELEKMRKPALMVLTDIVNDKSSPLREAAISALGKIRPVTSDAVRTLITNLKSDDYSVRRNIIEALAAARDKRSVYALMKIAKNERSDDRKYAISALGEIDCSEQFGLLAGFLSHENWEIRVKAASALGKLNDKRAVNPLIRSLKDIDDEVVGAAAEAIGRLKAKNAVPELLAAFKKAVKKDDASAIEKACRALGELGSKEAVELIVKCLDSRHDNIRYAAETALGSIGDPIAVAALLKRLKNRDFYERKYSVEALGKIKDKTALPDITKLLNDGDSRVAEAALKAVIGFEDEKKSVEAVNILRSGRYYDLSKLDARDFSNIKYTSAVEILAPVLKDDSFKNRAKAAEILHKIGWMAPNAIQNKFYLFARSDHGNLMKSDHEELAEFLIEQASNGDEEIKNNAIKTLGKLRSKKAFEYLMDRAGGGYYSYDTSLSAIDVIAQNPQPAMEDGLIKMFLNNSDTLKKQKIAEALSKIADIKNRDFYFKLCGDKDPVVRMHSAKISGEIRDSEAVELLTKMAIEDPEAYVQKTCVKTMVKIGKGGSPELVDILLRSADPELRAAAAILISNLKYKNMSSDLVKLFRDGSADVRKKAADALEGLKWTPADTIEAAFYGFAANRTEEISTDEKLKILAGELYNENSSIKTDLINYLGMIKNPIVGENLIELVNSKDHGVQIAAIETLGKIHEKRAKPALVQLLESIEPKPATKINKYIEWENELSVGNFLGIARTHRLKLFIINALREINGKN